MVKMDKERVFDKEMAELKDMILKMGVMVQGLIHNSIESLKQRNLDLAEQVIKEDKIVDQLELEIDEKCIELIALRQPEASDLRYIMTGTRIVTDLERIGDLAEDIAQRTKVLDGQTFPKPLIDIPKMAKLAQDAVAQVLEAFINRDSNKAKAVWEKEKEVDKLRDQVHDELVYEIKENIVSSVALEIKKIMESIIDSKKTYGVTCVADISVGQNWGELKQFKI